ncbi:hypothetical protein BGZ70_010673 [Mortierella alpina]|uniref:PDZ GRASP-type domain-containing protein n=1 Tax=Mortierella alpina TaxID=64518 RepID=A0A9P6IYP1_MORAP|nr:hypothetical protein BGZ70_010673 [Mortierella alpina]
MAVNDTRLNTESTVLRDLMEPSVDKPMVLDVYSTREQALRSNILGKIDLQFGIEMVPRRNWSGVEEDGLLGCSIRFTLFDTIIDVVWHVLDITPGSPAEQAGLCAHADYVIGTPLGIMRGEGDLYDLIEDYIGDPLPLHVYNVDRNQVREVVIVPSEEWGGEGLLGCDVGYGYKESSKEDMEHSAEQQVSSKDLIDPALDEKNGVNISKTAVEESKDTPSSRSPGPAPRPIDAQENPQLPGHEPQVANGNPGEPIPILEADVTPTVATQQPTLYPQVSSPPLYPKVAAHDSSLSGSTLANEDVDSKNHNATESTPEGEANDTSSNAPLASEEKPTLETEEPLSAESEQQQQQQRQPPPALAARMIPGIHGRGGRRGHDGYSARDRIPLQAAQAQAEEQSAEYRAQMERDLKDRRDTTTEGGTVIQDPKSPVQDSAGMTKSKGEDRDKVVEDNNNSMMEQQEADVAVHEFVVEGMIRNMALGSTVFPL